MEPLQCDILVVGAGPAGAAAAREAARQGANVLLVERRSAIGTPVQCAEFIPAMLKGKVNLTEKFVAQKILGMKTFRPDLPETITNAPGFIIHRNLFDQGMVHAAQNEGAKLMTATQAIDRSDSGFITLKRKSGELFQVEPMIVIGADGPQSLVGQWVGAINTHLLPGVQVTVELTRPLDYTEVYFRPDIFAGYAWLFPKDRFANVGLGLKRDSHFKESIRTILDRFVADLKSCDKIKGDPVAYAAGWIPAEPVRQTVFGSIALVGDAAGHTHPITGAGIFAAVLGGKMAGKWAGRAVKAKDTTLLTQYNDEWQDLMADTLDRAYQRRQHMETNWTDFNATIQKCWVAFRDYYAST
ncbi:MAG: NAD(P)/FAD-dependent oxidoreductase [Pseudomonadota bacterium]